MYRMSKSLLNPGCPLVAMGTSRSDPVLLQNAIKFGIECGFRVIDTAAVYGNHEPLQKALSAVLEAGLLTRSDLFIISKSGPSSSSAEDLEAECRDTLTKLKVEYLDLYLIHMPFLFTKDCTIERIRAGDEMTFIEDNLKERWRGLESLVLKGLVRYIGVSNFNCEQIDEILSFATIRPSVSQSEGHPYFSNQKLVDYCIDHEIQPMAYASLGTPNFKPRFVKQNSGHESLMKEDVLLEIAGRVGKSPAQILLKWAIQRGTIPIAKTVNLSHIRDNLDVEGFELTKAEMASIAGLERASGRVFTYMLARKSKYWHYE